MRTKKFISMILTVILVLTAGIEWTAVRSEAATITLTSSQIADYFNSKVGQTVNKASCLAFIADGFQSLGATRSSANCAYEYMLSHKQSDSMDNIPVGADVFILWGPDYKGTKYMCGNHLCHHIAVYVGGDYVVQTSGGKVIKSRLSEMIDGKNLLFGGWGIHGNVNISNSEVYQIFTNIRSSNVESDDATIYVDTPSKPYCTQVGFYISTDSSMANARRIPEDANCQVPGMFYNMKKWYGTLSEGTTYYYKFFAISGGTEYTTDVYNFTTLTGSPGDALFSSIYPENITENDARITGVLSSYKTIQDCGFQISTNPDMSGCATHYESDKNAGVNGAYAATIGYTMSDWHGTLQKGTVYYYRLFVKINGTTYMTSVQSFKTLGDSTPPVIQGVNVVSVDGYGYTISAKAADDNGMWKMSFPTWTENNGQDDLKAEWWDTTAVTSPDANGNYVYRVNISDHNYEGGKYITDVYAYDTSGNCFNTRIEAYVYPLDHITLSESSVTLNKGGTKYLSVGLVPDYTTDTGSISFTSSNNNIAIVDDTGKVTAKAVGEATITASVSGKSATCKVTVKSPLKSISLNKSSLDLTEGGSSTLSVSYNPTDTTDSKAITWTSSNTKVATVDKNGKVTAVGAGTATITATSAVKGVSPATCSVTVKKKEIHLNSISLSKASLSMTEGDSSTLTVSYDPSNTTDSKAITWTSSNTKVATVDKNGKVTAVGAGTATITATSAVKGVKEKTCSVTVNKKEIHLKNISLSKTSLSMTEGDSSTLTVSYDPSNTTDSKAITWTSSNLKVATVDKNGKVTAVGAGTATITATSAVKGVEAKSCAVKVNAKPDNTPVFGWFNKGDKSYWYENSTRQGTATDPNGVWGDGTNRGREIYDPDSDGWYWLDSIYDGAKAVGKEVWMPYIYQDEAGWDDDTRRNIAYESDEGMGECVLNAIRNKSGKWVRYDENGKMLKGWVTIEGALVALYPSQQGNEYYYDTRTGLMAKGKVWIDGVEHYFDETTGVKVF